MQKLQFINAYYGMRLSQEPFFFNFARQSEGIKATTDETIIVRDPFSLNSLPSAKLISRCLKIS